MKINWAVSPPQTRSTFNVGIERQIAELRNDLFSFPSLELEITPELAAHWLEWNECTRRISNSMVNSLTHMLMEGKFPFIGDPIRLGELNQKTLRRPLRDGQHRLTAIVRSGKSAHCLVLFDFSAALFPYVDSGAPRMARSFIVAKNDNIAALIAGASKLIWEIERKIFRPYSYGAARGTTRLSNIEILETFERHPQIKTWAEEAMKAKQMGLSSVVAASYWIWTTKDVRTDEFLSKLFDPSGLLITDMIYNLGERIRWERKTLFPGETGRRLMVWAIFRAWWFFSNNKSRKIFLLKSAKIDWPGGAPYLNQAANGNGNEHL